MLMICRARYRMSVRMSPLKRTQKPPQPQQPLLTWTMIQAMWWAIPPSAPRIKICSVTMQRDHPSQDISKDKASQEDKALLNNNFSLVKNALTRNRRSCMTSRCCSKIPRPNFKAHHLTLLMTEIYLWVKMMLLIRILITPKPCPVIIAQTSTCLHPSQTRMWMLRSKLVCSNKLTAKIKMKTQSAFKISFLCTKICRCRPTKLSP